MYLPFGGTRWESGATPTDFQFTGQRKEAGIGLYDYHARFYDPLIGRFINPDTIVPDPLNPISYNRYAYVGNNPLRHTDPDGHCWPVCTALVGAGLGFIGGMAVGMIAASIYHDTPEQARERIIASAALGTLAGAAIGVAPVLAPQAGTVLASVMGGAVTVSPLAAAATTAVASGGTAMAASGVAYNLSHSSDKFDRTEMGTTALIEGATAAVTPANAGRIFRTGINATAGFLEYESTQDNKNWQGYVIATVGGGLAGYGGSVLDEVGLTNGIIAQTIVRDAFVNNIANNTATTVGCVTLSCPQ